jgi:hypothetical protein
MHNEPKGDDCQMFLIMNRLYIFSSDEPETGHYLLHDNEYKSQAYLQGDDARIFRKEIERIDNLPDPEYKTGLLTENAISIYL